MFNMPRRIELDVDEEKRGFNVKGRGERWSAGKGSWKYREGPYPLFYSSSFALFLLLPRSF